MQLNKKVLSVLVALTLVFTASVSVLADPLTDKLNQQKSALSQQQKLLQDSQKDRQAMEVQAEKLDSQIETIMTQVQNIKNQIGDTQNQIKLAEADIKKSEDEIEEEQQLFDKRMRAMYINGTDSYVEVVLQSKSFSDLISNVETVKKLIDFDKNLISDMEVKKKVIINKKDALDVQNVKLLALKSDSDKKLAELNDTKNNQLKLIADIKKQENLYASSVNLTKNQINTTMKQIDDIRKAVPAYNPSRGAVSLSSNAIVAYASNFLGRSYQWGGNGPSTFDCSGFVKYVYAHFGVSLPRVASDQQNSGNPVSREQLEPGDLVFFGYPAHHVGMYVGNGCYIHAPKTGDVIKISSLDDRSDYSGARRFK